LILLINSFDLDSFHSVTSKFW